MFKLNQRLSLQRGISLLEVMLSLSIIAIILVMATRYFFTASDSQRINQAKAEVATVLSAVSTYGHNHGNNFETLTSMGVLISDGYLNSNLANVHGTAPSQTFSDAYGGNITVLGTANNATITIALPTTAACAGLMAGYSTGACDSDTHAFTLSAI